jgi:hypothetical protein
MPRHGVLRVRAWPLAQDFTIKRKLRLVARFNQP